MKDKSTQLTSSPSERGFVAKTNQEVNLKLRRMQELDREFERQARRLRAVSRRLRRKLIGIL